MSERPEPIGPVLWFALAAWIAAVLLFALGGDSTPLAVLAFLAVVAALTWTVTGLRRMAAIHRWAQNRTGATQ